MMLEQWKLDTLEARNVCGSISVLLWFELIHAHVKPLIKFAVFCFKTVLFQPCFCESFPLCHIALSQFMLCAAWTHLLFNFAYGDTFLNQQVFSSIFVCHISCLLPLKWFHRTLSGTLKSFSFCCLYVEILIWKHEATSVKLNCFWAKLVTS